jgi:2-methylcitrate dehydratase PrpD
MTAIEQLVDFSLAPGPVLPSRLRPRVNRLLLDSMAVMLAGYREGGPQALQRALMPTVDDVGVRLPWNDNRFRPDDACLLIGMSAHVLDYDDVSMVAVCHPSVPIFSALYVLAQQVQVTGEQFVEALALGTEVLIRSGHAMGFRHYELGFHATGTLGTLGVAAASARLLGLTASQTQHALAIAASMSGGLRKNFGSMVKSLHVGLAASSGLRAARMAEAGVQGAEEPIEGLGWLHALSGGETDRWPQHVALGQPFALDRPGFEQKRYPCCYLMHKIIQATLDLRKENGLSLEGFEHADILMPCGGTAPLIHPLPTNGLHAKFSGPYAVIGSLLDGRMNLASFEDRAVLRPQVQTALRRVRIREAEGSATQGSDVGGGPVTVALVFKDGTRYERTVVASPGSPEDPLSDDDLREKWRDCVARGIPGMGPLRIEELFESGLKFDQQPDAATWLLALR